jgi:hypothetical protein
VWDQQVTVEDGRPIELVLTPGTALVPRQVPAAPLELGYFLNVNAPAPSKAWAIVAPSTRRAYS